MKPTKAEILNRLKTAIELVAGIGIDITGEGLDSGEGLLPDNHRMMSVTIRGIDTATVALSKLIDVVEKL